MTRLAAAAAVLLAGAGLPSARAASGASPDAVAQAQTPPPLPTYKQLRERLEEACRNEIGLVCPTIATEGLFACLEDNYANETSLCRAEIRQQELDRTAIAEARRKPPVPAPAIVLPTVPAVAPVAERTSHIGTGTDALPRVAPVAQHTSNMGAGTDALPRVAPVAERTSYIGTGTDALPRVAPAPKPAPKPAPAKSVSPAHSFPPPGQGAAVVR